MTRLADAAPDDASALASGPTLPCICPVQTDAEGREMPAPGRARIVGISSSRGVDVQRVECGACGKTWTRIEP